MAKTIVIQRMGQTMKEGTLVKWLKKDGDTVRKGEPLYELEYDKDAVTVESSSDGILRILEEEGKTLPVSTAIAKLYTEGEQPKTGTETAAAAASEYRAEKRPEADAVVIGGGPGGYVAAIKLGMLGIKTILVERDAVGGTCLNRGCIPTKALLSSAEVVETIQNSAKMGVTVSNFKIDLQAINERKDKVVDTLVRGVKRLLEKRGVQTIAGTASFAGPNTVRVALEGGGIREITARNIIIASGSVSAKIPIEGIDGKNVITSTEALDVSELPGRLAVIGGGVIGMEIGSIYAQLGVQVTVLEALPQILPNMDEDVARAFRGIAEKHMTIYTGAKVTGISDAQGKKKVSYSVGGEEKETLADKVLVCVGRTPDTASLHLEAAGVAAERGRIVTDEECKTNVPGIYAIGDVNGKCLLAHAASAQGVFVAEAIAGHASGMDITTVPSCIYTRPEIASVGLTEAQAKDKGLDVKIGKFPFRANGKALAMGETDGFVKIVADAGYHEILGVHIIGPRATDMIAEAVLAIRMECTATELAGTIHAHPTLSEAVMEAAEDVLGEAIHMA